MGSGHDPQAQRVQQHVLAQLLCLGRHTLTGILSTSGRLFGDWTADYRMYSRPRVSAEPLFASVRRGLTDRLAPGQPLVAALDDTRVRKSGRKIAGVQYTRDPMGPPFHVNFIRAQRFVQISMACPADQGGARLVPIDFVHAPRPPKPARKAPEDVWEVYRQASRQQALPNVGADRLQRLRQALDEDGQADRPLWVAVDGGYTNRTFLRRLPERTLVVGRIRADAQLSFRPEFTSGRPGRHRNYGDRAPTPEALRQDSSVPWQSVEAFAAGRRHAFKIKTLGPVRWRVAGPHRDFQLLVIAPLGYRLTQHSRLLYRKPAYLLCSDPTASVAHVLQAALWRWDIETNFRDEKTLLGVGQAQVRHERSVQEVPALAVAAYALLLTSAIQAFGPLGHPEGLPPPKWRRKRSWRASTQCLLQHLRYEMWSHALRFSRFVSRVRPDTKPPKLHLPLDSALLYSTQ